MSLPLCVTKVVTCTRLVMWGPFGYSAHTEFGIFGDISVLIMGLYFFQGISVIHSTGREKQVATGWFSALYFLLFLLPQFVGLFIIVAGILDSFISLRNDAGS